MKKSMLEKELQKAIQKEKAKKLLKKDFLQLQKEKELKEIENVKKQLKEKKAIAKEKKEKEKRKILNLKEFEKRIEKAKEKEKEKTFESKIWKIKLYWKQEKSFDIESQFAFSWKDFYIHNSILLESENEKKLINIYNQIEWIWKWMNLNEIEKIILENLKKRLIFEFCENFESNLKKQNSKNIKILNAFFLKSNLKKYLKNAKENKNLNIFENDFENIYWKQENYWKRFLEKMNWKCILKEISFQEKIKAKVKARKKKLNENERKEIEKKRNWIENLKKILKEKENIKSIYNLESKRIDFSLKENKFLLKVNWKLERMKRKVFERNWIDLKEKELKEKEKELKEIWIEIEKEIQENELTWKELKEKRKEFEKARKEFENIWIELKEIWKRKKEIELKLYWMFKNQIEKIYNHWKLAKEKAYSKYLQDINNCNSKMKNIEKNFLENYWKLAKELTWKEIQENYLKAYWKEFSWIVFEWK